MNYRCWCGQTHGYITDSPPAGVWVSYHDWHSLFEVFRLHYPSELEKEVAELQAGCRGRNATIDRLTSELATAEDERTRAKRLAELLRLRKQHAEKERDYAVRNWAKDRKKAEQEATRLRAEGDEAKRLLHRARLCFDHLHRDGIDEGFIKTREDIAAYLDLPSDSSPSVCPDPDCENGKKLTSNEAGDEFYVKCDTCHGHKIDNTSPEGQGKVSVGSGAGSLQSVPPTASGEHFACQLCEWTGPLADTGQHHADHHGDVPSHFRPVQ